MGFGRRTRDCLCRVVYWDKNEREMEVVVQAIQETITWILVTLVTIGLVITFKDHSKGKTIRDYES